VASRATCWAGPGRALGNFDEVLDGTAQRFAFRGARGTPHACAERMAVRDFRDLLCWQLSYELKCEVFAFTAKGAASRDFKYRDQIRDSAAAAPRDISEGFGRFRPREFARFLEFARASLMETETSLIDGRDRGYLTPELGSRLLNLAAAALRVTTSLMRSKQRQAAGVTRPGGPPKRSFSISIAELEARRERRQRSRRGKA
jgi:four helix bundle protein